MRGWDELMAEPGFDEATPRLVFISYDLLHKVLAPNRMAIVEAMMGAGPLSIREISRRVGRDFKGVHTDVTMLLDNTILYRTADGLVVFPYDKIRFDFHVGGNSLTAA